MKRNRANIFYSWLLLICFIAGQYVVYAHQHKIVNKTSTQTIGAVKHQPHTIVQENCSACDAMHHNSAVINSYVYYSPNIVTKHFYQVYNYNFISISLVLSAGRAPPVVSFC